MIHTLNIKHKTEVEELVKFEASVYNQEENNVTGVRVLVKSEVGDTIEDVIVLDPEQLSELLNQKVATADLNTLLMNVGEVNNINASTLAGHDIDDFAAVNHSHDADTITGLYNYSIWLSKYNMKIGETITVSVKVEDYGGNPVGNKLISIQRDGKNWVNGKRTNANGIYSTSFVADTPGVTTFACNSNSVQCNIQDEWKQVPLSKTMPFECNLWILESQKLANLVMYIPRYVGWCKHTSTSGMKPDEIDQDSIRFISENKDAVSDSKRKYLFNGTNTEEVLPLEYCPPRTISQPLYRSNYVVYLHRDGSLSGMAREYTTNSSNVNWSVDVHFNQVWSYGINE